MENIDLGEVNVQVSILEEFEKVGDIIKSEENDVLSNALSGYTLSLRRIDFTNEKEFIKFIKNVERLVRISNEYRLWTSYLRDAYSAVKCQVTDESVDDVTIEIHHHPFSLYLIIKGILCRRMIKNEPFCSFDIAAEAILLHFRMKVGYVVLVSSLHEKFHNGAFDIPMEIVRGDYQYLVDNILPYLDEHDVELVRKYLSVDKSNCNWTLKWISSRDLNVEKKED